MHHEELLRTFEGRYVICRNTCVRTLLQDFSISTTRRLEMFSIMDDSYRFLLMEACHLWLPKEERTVITRTGDKQTEAGVICRDKPVVVVNVVRAGDEPTKIGHKFLLRLGLQDNCVVEHTVFAERKTNGRGEVTHTEFDMRKAQGKLPRDCTLIVLDPMGATGGTTDDLIKWYKEQHNSKITRVMVLFLIAAPPAIERVLSKHSETHIMTGRADGRIDEHGYIRDGGAGDIGATMSGC